MRLGSTRRAPGRERSQDTGGRDEKPCVMQKNHTPRKNARSEQQPQHICSLFECLMSRERVPFLRPWPCPTRSWAPPRGSAGSRSHHQAAIALPGVHGGKIKRRSETGKKHENAKAKKNVELFHSTVTVLCIKHINYSNNLVIMSHLGEGSVPVVAGYKI